jgi:hypothetical protein
MSKTFIEMGLRLEELTPVHDTFHGVIPGQSPTPIGRIDLDVSYGSGDNKHREKLMFEVASFDIGYNYIIGRPFLFKFMTVIHTASTTMKMPSPKNIITIKADQRHALACENTSLSHAGHFGDKAAQEQAIKVAKTKCGNTSSKPSASKPPISSIPWSPPASKDTNIASVSTPSFTD